MKRKMHRPRYLTRHYFHVSLAPWSPVLEDQSWCQLWCQSWCSACDGWILILTLSPSHQLALFFSQIIQIHVIWICYFFWNIINTLELIERHKQQTKQSEYLTQNQNIRIKLMPRQARNLFDNLNQAELMWVEMQVSVQINAESSCLLDF